MDESDVIIEFMKISKCDRADAISCLSEWGYDLKRALIDYNGKSTCAAFHFTFIFLSPSFIADTSTQNYFKSKTKTNRDETDDVFPVHLTNSMDVHPKSSSLAIHQDIRNSSDKDSRLAANYRPLLNKTDSIDLDCKCLIFNSEY